MEKKSCWFYGSGQEEKLSVLLLFGGERVEKLWNIVIGKAVGELCPKSSGLQATIKTCRESVSVATKFTNR